VAYCVCDAGRRQLLDQSATRAKGEGEYLRSRVTRGCFSFVHKFSMNTRSTSAATANMPIVESMFSKPTV
jgi:hypothetical protein